MMNPTAQTLLSIVRSAAGTGGTHGPVLLSSRQWKRLFQLSVSQNLAALVYGELSRLGHDMPEFLEKSWKEYADFCYAKFDAQLMALTHLSQFLESNGIRVMVLKGLGLALLYPEPQCRECSDIDIYCFGEYGRVNELLLKSGLVTVIEEEGDKHCSFSFDGINVENHSYFCEYVNSANITVGNELLRLSETDVRTDSRLPGILFPGPQMGALHLTMHTISHMAWSGITLRQILDLGLYFNRNKDAFDHDSVIGLWNRTGIADAAFSLCTLSEALFGIDTGMVGGMNAKNGETAEVILKGILNPCLQSAQVRNPLSKLSRKIRYFRFRSVMHSIAYGEPFPDSFWKSFSFFRRWTS